MKRQFSYYVSGNTADGYVNFIESNLKGIAQIYVLHHPSSYIKTELLQSFLQTQAEDDVEVLLSPLGEEYLDGVINRKKSVAVIIAEISGPILSQATLINLEDDIPASEEGKHDLQSLQYQFNKRMQEAYEQFATGLKIHDKLEGIFIGEMDFAKADEIAEQFIHDLLKDEEKKEKQSQQYHRLFGTNTKEGAVNIVPTLLKDLKKSYFIKGRAGTGKSTFMKKVLAACEDYGFDLELYHCSFDPNSIDMVLVRELGFCIFDSTDPHEFFPSRKGEETIDMYKETVKDGTDEKYAEEIVAVTKEYKSHMKQGIAKIKEADIYVQQINEKFTLSENEMNQLSESVLQKINK